MSAVGAGSLAASAARRLPRGQWSAESGLRLLVAADGSGALRWSPDPDGPDLRALAPGEIRLTIRSFSVGATARRDVLRADLAGRADGPGRVTWRSIPALGLAEVTESNSASSPVGSWRRGLLHVGTHLVVGADRLDGLQVVSPGDPGQMGSRGTWGRDAVERLIAAWRDGAHGDEDFGPMSLTSIDSSFAASAPISVASWHRRQAARWPRASSKKRRLR